MPTFVLGGSQFDSGTFDSGTFDGGASGPILRGPVVVGTLEQRFVLSGGPVLGGPRVAGSLQYTPLGIVLSGGPILAGLVVGGTLRYTPPLPIGFTTLDLYLGRVGAAHGDYALPTLTVTGLAQNVRELVGSAKAT